MKFLMVRTHEAFNRSLGVCRARGLHPHRRRTMSTPIITNSVFLEFPFYPLMSFNLTFEGIPLLMGRAELGPKSTGPTILTPNGETVIVEILP